MVRSFLQAALYSSVAILTLLLIWSRSVQTTLLAASSVLAGIGLLLALMRWGPFDVHWNVANLFAVPILIGISVDGVIHLVRAWRLGTEETFQGATEAVLMSSLTTMTGFGILATASHAGVSSLGLVVFLGIGAYTSAVLSAHHGLSPFLVAPFAGLVAVVVAAVIGSAPAGRGRRTG
jgi:uncharacterized protein